MQKPQAAQPEWLRLQRKIFSRWVSQKLWMTRHIRVEDVIKSISDDPTVLLALAEVLSEKTYKGPKLDKGKMRVMKISSAEQILNFIFRDCGVVMKMRPSAEDIVDGQIQNVLGLIFSIMIKYMKFEGEDSESTLNAKDALLLWCKNKTASYGLKVENFTSSFHSGLVLCAIVNKHRPKLLDYSALDQTNKLACVTAAMDAANRYFGLEKYITPEEFLKLDESGMFVYVSEYYYGIAEQRKLDMAARRITKVIKFTITCDNMRAEFAKSSAAFKERLANVEKVLEDRTIDNTMAGAKRKIEEFYAYKNNDKSVLLGLQLNLEGTFTNLSMLLASNKRPEFVPPAGLSLDDINKAMEHLEQVELERNIALHNEYNRQLRLIEEDKNHKLLFEKLNDWINLKTAYLNTKAVCDSVSAARFALQTLDAFVTELHDVTSTTAKAFASKTQYLVDEKYEHSDEVLQRDALIKQGLTTVGTLSEQQRPVLEDDLARETFRENLRIEVLEYNHKVQAYEEWAAEKSEVLAKRDELLSVPLCSEQITLLNSLKDDLNDAQAGLLAPITAGCQKIVNAKYETQYSSYEYEDKQGIQSSADNAATRLQGLHKEAEAKETYLKDCYAREVKKEEIRIEVLEYNHKVQAYEAWAAEKSEVLAKRDELLSVPLCSEQITLLNSLKDDLNDAQTGLLAPIIAKSEKIINDKYESPYSFYEYEDKQGVKAAADNAAARLQGLHQEAAAKEQYLNECLAREEKKEELRLKYAVIAGEMERMVKNACDQLAIEHFGYTLEEVTAYAQNIAENTTYLMGQSETITTKAQGVKDEMDALQCYDNPFTQHTPETLAQLAQTLADAIAKRKEAYDAELARQQYNDQLCQKFAAAADPVAKNIVERKNGITHSQGTLREQLGSVEGLIASAPEDGKCLEGVNAVQAEMDQAGITNNKHTPLTAKDLEVQWGQYTNFLDKKKQMLLIEIEHAECRGITPEQFQEIEDNFKLFDKNGNGQLDIGELKACLYSLGEEMNMAKITEIATQYGDGKIILYDGFKKFMIHVLGDTDTKEEIVSGFELIARGEQNITKEQMDLVMPEHDVEYVVKTAPQVNGAFDYRAWTEDVFSR